MMHIYGIDDMNSMMNTVALVRLTVDVVLYPKEP